MKTVLLLCCSNIFMTIAWYGHLKYRKTPLFAAIVVSWLIAFAEYCFQVPANRIGYGEFTGFQLKIIQEVITLVRVRRFRVGVSGRKRPMEPRGLFPVPGGRRWFCILG